MITNIRLQNFRSYKDASFEFEDGVNVVVGPNASGKTNLLEAVLVVARGKSYRAKDTELIMHKKPWARIDADVGAQHRTIKLQSQDAVVKKTFELDDTSLSRLALNRQLPVVLFEPNQLQQITTSPEQRRSFLDSLLEQTSAEFAQARRHYNRALIQRNALLKRGSAASKQLFAWNIRLSELGGEIVKHRLALIELLNKDVAESYSTIAGRKHRLKLVYSSKISASNYATALLQRLERDEELDQLRGFTGAGPHRDDLQILIDGQPLQHTASRGETRTVLLALKIKEAKIIEEQRGIKPLLLLDDVFGELDGKRRHVLTDFLKAYQVFITTTDADLIVKNFNRSSNVIVLEGGV